MTTPRTISGQAAISAMRPHVKRALGTTIVAIEKEAATPYRDALIRADGVLAEIVALEPGAEWDRFTRANLVERAAAARRLAIPLLAEPPPEKPA